MNRILHSEAAGLPVRRTVSGRWGIRLLVSFAMLLFSLPLAAQTAKVTISKQGTVKQILNEIEAQTDYLFVANAEVDLKRKVSVNTRNESVRDLLEKLLPDKTFRSYSKARVLCSRRLAVPPQRRRTMRKSSAVV